MVRANTVIAERFRVETLAGFGGMGSVYRGRDVVSGEPVAIKMMPAPADADRDSRHRDRFVREAKILAKLDHPGIVRYIDHGLTGAGEAYLVMEWLEAIDLKERIRNQPLSEEQTVAAGTQIASALAAAHRLGVVHRDIKPHNLLLDGGDLHRIKIIDFGIARAAAAPSTMAPALTHSGVLVGTPGYLAPEQARGDRIIDGRADLYALGAVLYFCLTGRPPFIGDHIMAILAKMHFEEAPRVSSVCPKVSSDLDELIDQLMSKDPHGRPSSAEEVVSLLATMGDNPDRSAAGSGPRAMSSSEQRYVSLLLIGQIDLEDGPGARDDVVALATHHGGTMERLADDAVATVFSSQADADETAGRAARMALALRQAYPGAPIAVATGRSLLHQRVAMGEVIDRAVDSFMKGQTAVLEPPSPDLGRHAHRPGQADGDVARAALLHRRRPRSFG